MMSIDDGKQVLLVLLTLSAVFDTVDHNAHFSRLKDMFGLSRKMIIKQILYIWHHHIVLNPPTLQIRTSSITSNGSVINQRAIT